MEWCNRGSSVITYWRNNESYLYRSICLMLLKVKTPVRTCVDLFMGMCESPHLEYDSRFTVIVLKTGPNEIICLLLQNHTLTLNNSHFNCFTQTRKGAGIFSWFIAICCFTNLIIKGMSIATQIRLCKDARVFFSPVKIYTEVRQRHWMTVIMCSHVLNSRQQHLKLYWFKREYTL